MEQGFKIAAELELFPEGIAYDAHAIGLLQVEGGGIGEGGGEECGKEAACWLHVVGRAEGPGKMAQFSLRGRRNLTYGRGFAGDYA
jgi:hypothetical protein